MGYRVRQEWWNQEEDGGQMGRTVKKEGDRQGWLCTGRRVRVSLYESWQEQGKVRRDG